jgi:hypothetical protein
VAAQAGGSTRRSPPAAAQPAGETELVDAADFLAMLEELVEYGAKKDIVMQLISIDG